MEAVKDDAWLKGDFIKTIQGRGAAIIKARKLSSAMSAAKAVCDHMRDWWFGTRPVSNCCSFLSASIHLLDHFFFLLMHCELVESLFVDNLYYLIESMLFFTFSE